MRCSIIERAAGDLCKLGDRGDPAKDCDDLVARAAHKRVLICSNCTQQAGGLDRAADVMACLLTCRRALTAIVGACCSRTAIAAWRAARSAPVRLFIFCAPQRAGAVGADPPDKIVPKLTREISQ